MMMQQKQLSKQRQLIDQSFSNGIMLNAIAALENLAFYYGYNGKRIFDYYSGYAKRTSENELVNAAIIQLEIFRNSHLNYSSIYEEYNFPKNLSKEQIIKTIKDWKKVVPQANKEFYQEILNYLNGNSDFSGISETINQKKKEWGPTTKEDIERIGRNAPFINTQMFNQMEIVKENYDKNGNYEIMANLNKNREDDIDMQRLNQYEQQFSQQEMNFRIVEKKLNSFFEHLIMTRTLKNSDVEEVKQLVVSFRNLINGIGFEEVEIKQKISLFKNYKENIKTILIDKNALNFFSSICDEIISIYLKKDFSSNC
jgi:hypothetical protein